MFLMGVIGGYRILKVKHMKMGTMIRVKNQYLEGLQIY